MLIEILTIFPEMLSSPLAFSIVKRAQDENKVKIQIHNLRDWASDNYKTVDDRPYGGGAGMVMKVDVVDRAVESLKSQYKKGRVSSVATLPSNSVSRLARSAIKPTSHSETSLDRQNDGLSKVVLLDTKGEFYHQGKAKELSRKEHLILIAPHFEGIDHRVHEYIADEVICIGPYVLTGGELPAMIIIDSVTRLLPGVIKEESLIDESFNDLLATSYQLPATSFEYPQYTRPAEYKGWKVPEVLLNGNHAEIEKWRKNI